MSQVREKRKERRRTVSNTHSTDELSHSLGVEEVADHSVALALVETTLGTASNDTARVLTDGGERGKEKRRERRCQRQGFDRIHRRTGRSSLVASNDVPTVLEKLETLGKLGRDMVLGRKQDSEDTACEGKEDR
jgi:hypothetical protein